MLDVGMIGRGLQKPGKTKGGLAGLLEASLDHSDVQHGDSLSEC